MSRESLSKKSPQDELKELAANLVREIAQWKYLYQYGGQDPFYSDGVNICLTRNHVLYYKGRIMEICTDNKMKIPDDYYLATPPEVSMDYFASPKSERAMKILRDKKYEPTKRVVYEKKELVLF